MSIQRKNQKLLREDLVSHPCIFCNSDCNEDQTNTTIESWEKIKENARQWIGLDTFESV